jgi:hypothetical protein
MNRHRALPLPAIESSLSKRTKHAVCHPRKHKRAYQHDGCIRRLLNALQSCLSMEYGCVRTLF